MDGFASKPKMSRRRKTILWASAAFVGLLAIGAANDDGGKGSTETTALTRNATPAIASKADTVAAAVSAARVEMAGPNMWVDVESGELWDDKSAIDHLALAADRAGRAIKSGAPDVRPDTTMLQLGLMVPTIGGLGDAGKTRLITASFDMKTLRSVNYDALTANRVLDLAAKVDPRGRLGRETYEAWCRDNASDAAAFCTKG